MAVRTEEERERVADLRAEGFGYKRISRATGIPTQTVFRWLNPEYAERQRLLVNAAKKRRTGVCSECGGPTRYNGHDLAVSEVCGRCARDLMRYWTEERILDAIHRFAAIHGRPPLANEWILADPVNGYPPRSAVYGRPPFMCWADAIEAAGFPRPEVGKYERVGLVGAGFLERQIVATLRRHGPLKRNRIGQIIDPAASPSNGKRLAPSLDSLLRRGLVRRLGGGVYELT